jgi:hypothetical protein
MSAAVAAIAGAKTRSQVHRSPRHRIISPSTFPARTPGSRTAATAPTTTAMTA